MKTVTFEIQRPVRELCPQWIEFIHDVNDAAVSQGGQKPFGDPIEEKAGTEIYPEAILRHSQRDNGTDGGVGILRFEATSDRVVALFGAAVLLSTEANKKLINRKYWGLDRHPGDYYARKQAMTADASRKLQRAKDSGADMKHLNSIRAELEAARYVGD